MKAAGPGHSGDQDGREEPRPRKSASRHAIVFCLGTACLLSGLGCPPPPPFKGEQPPTPPRELRDIVEVIRHNDAMLNQPLWSQGVSVTARFKDDKGREHTYNLEGSFLFRKPHNLRLDLRPSVGDPVMQIGSNDQDYWIWIEPEIKAMRWGRYRHVGKPCADQLTVRPDQLGPALGLAGLPDTDDGLIGPARKYGRTHDILYYLRQKPGGEYILEQEYWIDRSPPYMIRRVLYRDTFGQDVMSSLLDDYRPAWEGGPLIAHTVSIIWPKKDGQLTMWIGATKAMPPEKVGPKAFLRPQKADLPSGIERIIQVDADCDALETKEPADKEPGEETGD